MNDKKEKLLVVVDGSERSYDTVRYVANYVPFRDMKVTLFNVFNAIPKYYQDLQKDPQFHKAYVEVCTWEAEQRKVIDEFMNKAVKKLTHEGFSKNDVEVKVQNKAIGVARDILTEAKNGYRFVVAGRKGVSRITQIALGSTAAKLVEAVTFVPVILVGNRQPPSENILVAIDGSEGANLALDFVGKILGPHRPRVTLVHVIRRSEESQSGFRKYYLPDGSYVIAENEAKSMFTDATNRLVEMGFKHEDITTKILTAISRSAAIVNEADEGVYGAIVMGRRGISKVQEFFLGRVSNKVVQMARKHTVWIVGSQTGT